MWRILLSENSWNKDLWMVWKSSRSNTSRAITSAILLKWPGESLSCSRRQSLRWMPRFLVSLRLAPSRWLPWAPNQGAELGFNKLRKESLEQTLTSLIGLLNKIKFWNSSSKIIPILKITIGMRSLITFKEKLLRNVDTGTSKRVKLKKKFVGASKKMLN